jgi:chitinase
MANSPTPMTMALAVLALGLALLVAAGPAAAHHCSCRPRLLLQQVWLLRHHQRLLRRRVQVGAVLGLVWGSWQRRRCRCVRGERRHQVKSHAGSWCQGTGFYTRGAFLEAVGANPGFARGGSEADRMQARDCCLLRACHARDLA